jgi:hypothetical protein
MYLLIIPSNAASYDNYTIVLSADKAGFLKVWWTYLFLYFWSY